ncbi:hypothetical protein D6853_12980 [Butyrivibrio sp. X503]|uniref:FkbM family methyltransferase n=1 Tax=Butyrivibrio sp. X503 TaxID=2364878 RepID=UPI000EA88832|nr:FkbM family methyltransferase [Butyrivibrio sp. X503]RKM54435.1 hypothetical protein D6853_12980 [Butyrivibrio sp. X503]
MNKKALIWGVGNSAVDLLKKKCLYSDYEIIAFVDNNRLLWGGEKSFKGLPILSPFELKTIEYDLIIIASIYKDEIYNQLLDMGVTPEKITDVESLEERIKAKIIDKYRYSDDEEIKKVVDYYKKNKLNIFGTYFPSTQEYEVFWDEDYPYVMLDGKKMYYPRAFFERKTSERVFVPDVLYEQYEQSPHLYIKKNHCVKRGDVIVDAGVCEGNFALRYIDEIKKVYLVECSSIWREPLEKTFHPYKDKVVFCWKELSRSSSSKTIALDDLVQEKIDFLKMDIEGAEVDAVLGAKKLLKSSNAKCSICCYHRRDDEENLKFILESLGYSTSTSEGRMFFSYDPMIGESLDLRHGIVYAEKNIW